MKFIVVLILLVVVGIVIYAMLQKKSRVSDLKVGTVFFTKGYEKSGSRVKVLAIDNINNVKIYGLQFQPAGESNWVDAKDGRKINTSSIGHLPICESTLLTWGFDIEGWEEVKENELEGYKMWKEASSSCF